MTKLLQLICILFIFSGCRENNTGDLPPNSINPEVVENPATADPSAKKKVKAPVMKFVSDVHDFGTIIQGEKVSFAFKFVNTGDGDLVIRSANGSCGCTVPEFPKEPIPPGGDGLIKVTFNSEGKEGQQNKTITLISNTIPNTYTLTVKGNIIIEKK